MKNDSGNVQIRARGAGALEEQYRLLLECVTDYALVLLDIAGRVTAWNVSAERMFGYQETEILGRRYSCFFTPEDLERSLPEKELRAAAKGRVSDDRWFVRKDGSQLWGSGITTPLRDERGNLRGFAQVIRDRSEQKWAEEARFRLSRIVESSDDAIIGKTLNGIIVSWNAGAERLYGHRAEEMLGKPITLIVPPNFYHELEDSMERVKRGQPIEPYETIRVRKDGSQVHVSVSVSPIKDVAGRVIGASSIARDITSQKQAEEMERRLARHALLRAEVALALADKECSFARMLQRCADALIRHLETAFVRIWILHPEEKVLKLRASAGMEAPAESGGLARVPAAALKIGLIVQERQPHFTNDVRNDSRVSDPDWARQQGMTAFAGYPLLVDDRLIGVIALLARRSIGNDTLDALASVADVVAQGIERRRAEEELRESEHRFRQLAENLHEVFWMSDPLKPALLYLSPAFEQIWGRPCRTFQGNPGAMLETVHPEDRERVERGLKRQQQGEQTEAEYRVVRPDGSVRWIWDRAFPIKDRTGRVYRVAGIAEDVTARKRAEEERAQLLVREQLARTEAEAAEQRASFLAKASTVLGSSLDYETTLTSVARLAVPHIADSCTVELLGEDGALRQLAVAGLEPSQCLLAQEWQRRHPADQSTGCRLPSVLRTRQSEVYPALAEGPPGAAIAAPEQLQRLRDLGLKSAMVVPLVARGKNLGVISFITAESGRLYGRGDLALAEDLARRAAIAIDNAQLYKEVREGDRRKEEFLAMLAHELRNPLAPIRNALHVLRLPEARADLVEKAQDMMARQVQHMVRLVDDLLDVSRITRGKIQLRCETLNLAALIRTTAEDRRGMLEHGGLTLTVDVPATPIWVHGDATRLAQILNNLLDNTAKFTDHGGRAEVRLTVDSERCQAVLTVRDNGIGIDAEMLPRLFDVFAQADRSLARSRGGLGLGLALVKGLADLHRGEVQAASEGPGRGTELTVRLPLESAPQPSNAPPAAVPESSRPLRILIVEDNHDTAHSLRMLLQLQGHEVAVTYTGPEALRKAAEWLPDVVLCDIGLPGLDGHEVARRLRGNPATVGIRLIAISGYGQEEDRRRSEAAGFECHLTKPCEPETLRKLLRGVGTAAP